MKTIENAVDQIIVKIKGQNIAHSVSADQRLFEDLHLLPIEVLEIFLLLKTVLGVIVKPEAARNLKTVRGLYEYAATHAEPERLTDCLEKIAEVKFVKIFADLAFRLAILPHELVFALEALIGMKVRKDLDLSRMPISTLYLMQDIAGGCQANCAFCVQAKDSRNERKESMLVDNKLLRLPVTAMADGFNGKAPMQKGVQRICIQTIFNKQTVGNLLELVGDLRSFCSIPITACCIPVSKESLNTLKKAGLDMIFINYETATRQLFSEIRGQGRKGPYRWDKVTQSIDDALAIFGNDKVGSHLQIGFGETQKDALQLIQNMTDKNARVSLIAFRPIPGTYLEKRMRSSYENYHKIQLGSYLIQKHIRGIKDMTFDSHGHVIGFGMDEHELEKIIQTGQPFKNRGGCPGCNRIYYETNPGERFYAYPRDLDANEIDMIRDEIIPQEASITCSN